VLVAYARTVGLSIGDVPWSLLLLVASGHVGTLSLLAFCALAGCAVAATRLALESLPGGGEPGVGAAGPAIRGPAGYAGPGSLGGTDSGMRMRR
jgi:hypothetical protein